MKVNNDGYLTSRMHLRAKLLSSISRMSRDLQAYPNLQLIEQGSGLRYIIELKDMKDRFYILTLETDGIDFEVYSKISPLYLMQESLLRLLSIASFLSDSYDFDFKSLFPYLIEVLANGPVAKATERVNTGKESNGGDIILAKRIVNLMIENTGLKNERTAALSKFSRMTSLFILSRYGSFSSLDQVEKDTGLNREDVLISLRAMAGIGYRVIYLNREDFNLVRA